MILQKSGVELPEQVVRVVLQNDECTFVGVVGKHMNEFKSLMQIDLSGHKVQDMNALACFPALQELSLACNHISDIRLGSSGGGMNFGRLTALDLSYNLITQESIVELGKLPQLQILDLSHNALSELPPLLSDQFTQLKKLVLRGNRFGKVKPTESSDGEPIKEYLDPSSDFFRPHYAFFDTLGRMPRLRELDLSSNLIQVVPRLTPRSFPSLRLMNLSLNYLDRETYLLTVLSLPRLAWLDVRANLFVPIDSNAAAAPVGKLTRFDFPAICQRLLRTRRGNVIISNPAEGSKDEKHIVRADVLCAEAERNKMVLSSRVGTADVDTVDDPLDEPEIIVQDPTERLEEQLESFGVEEDNTFLTTATMGGDAKGAGEPWLSPKSQSRLRAFGDQSKKANLKELEWAMKRPSLPAPIRCEPHEQKGRHHLKSTKSLKARRTANLKKRARQGAGRVGARKGSSARKGTPAVLTMSKILDKVEDNLGPDSHRMSRTGTGRRSARSQRSSARSLGPDGRPYVPRDIQEILDTVQKILSI